MTLTLVPEATETDPSAPTRLWPRLVRAPQTEPPFDDEGSPAAPALDGTLALALPLALPRPPRPTRPGLRLLPSPSPDQLGPPTPLPAPGPRAEQLVRAVLEVLAGERPTRHLARVVTPRVLLRVEDAARRTRTRPWARSLRSMRVSAPASGVAEVSAVVARGSRCCALAMRLEAVDGRWVVTDLALG